MVCPLQDFTRACTSGSRTADITQDFSYKPAYNRSKFVLQLSQSHLSVHCSYFAGDAYIICHNGYLSSQHRRQRSQITTDEPSKTRSSHRQCSPARRSMRLHANNLTQSIANSSCRKLTSTASNDAFPNPAHHYRGAKKAVSARAWRSIWLRGTLSARATLRGSKRNSRCWGA